MKFRNLAVGLSVLTVINSSAPTIKVFANNEMDIKNITLSEATINPFLAYDDEKYNEAFKIDNSNIESIKNNAGNNVGKYITNAIDGDISTEWSSNKVNTDTFKNEVEITFKEAIEISRVIYGARQSDSKGFAEEFEIYASKTESEDDYELITTGKHNPVKGLIEAKFNNTEFKRMKFKFTKGKDNWASISEIAFYKEDIVSDKMDRLFTDNTLSVVNEEFNTLEKIQELENEVKLHPLYDMYKSKIEDAKTLVSNDKVVATQAKIKEFNAFDNNEYNEIFKMNNLNIESIKNNAGNNVGKYITNAIDGDISTEWTSNTVNTDAFKNEVEITFKEKVELDRVIYGARQSDSKGFAEEFEIYGSKTTSGDTYELIATGKYNPVKGLIEAKFNNTEFKRMKFKFTKGKDNWASMSEIAFYKEDIVSYKMDRLFTDNTLSVVNEEFNTLEKIQELENEVKLHPLYDMYKSKIEDAKTLVSNDKVVATQAKIKVFNAFDNNEYSERFKMNNSNIESIKNNAGNNVGKYITNAIDGDISTEWTSNTVNTDTFKNEVEITFKEKVELDRVIYGARQSDSKGFAEEFEIYGSKTTSGDTYELIATGKYNPVKGLIEAKFNNTEFKRMKFKFTKGKDNWASMSEIAFYKEDELTHKMDNMFTDGTMTKLKEEFNSIESIDLLQVNVASHPSKDDLQKLIDRAYLILNNKLEENQVKMTLPQFGNVHGNATTNLQMSSVGTNFITTGIVAKPGEIIEVYVDADKEGPLPEIVFSQTQGHYGNWRRNYKLNPGYNKFIVPEIFDENWPHKANKGGAVYIVNPYTSDEQKQVPIVSIEGGQKFPVFNKGDNKEEFIEELKAYKQYIDENPDTAVDIYEFNTERVLFTGTATDAYQVYVNESVDIEESIDTWNSRFDEGFKFAGLEDNPKEVNHDSTNLRAAVRVMQPFGAAYAAGDHIGIQKHVADDFLRPDAKSVKGIAWGTMHELGHQMDIRSRTWGEVTNNMWANNVYIKEGFGCKIDYNFVDKEVALNHTFEEKTGTNLAMFWQLEAYKPGYWAQLERMYRERKPNPSDYQEKKDILALYSSEIIGKNLTEYYERYGFNLSENAKAELSKLPKLDQKIWYVHSNAMEYKGNGYNENLNVKINSNLNEENKTNTLTFEMDEENKNAFLGYEIIKDGVVIGFTRTNQFVVENIDINENAKYEVVPYDLKVNKGKSTTIEAFTPVINSDDKITLEVNEKFDLNEYVVAKNYKNETLNNIDINHNIDISKAGIYNIEYSVIDRGIKSTTNTEVEVVSKYDYLSDYDWKSVSTQYGTPRKNSNIKIKKNGKIRELEKGFGIHANGEIIYDLSDKNYEKFEALLGVDASIMSQNQSSIIFEIIVDGKVVETTDILRHKDDAVYVNIPIKDAKELKIQINDSGNGNSSDHAVIANPKLTNNNTKPSLNIGDDNVKIKLGSEYNLLDSIVANDIEDGDLTQKIEIDDNGFDANKSGVYNVVYTVTDSNNNTTSKTKTVLVYNDINYASDIEWVSATSGWRTVNKDKAVASENKIKLKVNGEIKEFDKGIGAATNSEIVYNLEDKDYIYFSTYLGTDKNYNDSRTSIDFKILADGVEVYSSKTIRRDSESEFVQLNIEGVKELKLIANDHDGSGLGDFVSWADTKFYTTNAKLVQVLEDLKSKVDEVSKIDTSIYTQESVKNLEDIMLQANELIKSTTSTKEEIAKMISKLDQAVKTLEIYNIEVNIKDSVLEEEIRKSISKPEGQLMSSDLEKLVTLNIEFLDIESLEGLEHAKNLETLDISMNSINDLTPLRNLKKLNNFVGRENFISTNVRLNSDNNYVIDSNVIDIDGEKLIPSEILLSPFTDAISINVDDVMVDGKIVLPSELVGKHFVVDIKYNSKSLNYEFFNGLTLSK